MDALRATDPEIASLIAQELARQRAGIELIASENFTSPAVLEAMGSVLTNKYSEGYPGKRYYGGNNIIDQVELLAIERAKKLFGADHANVQPHSGSQANMAVYFALLKPGDSILSMDLAHGGHLTHGSKVSFSGQLYTIHSYGVDVKTERIDYDEVRSSARKIRPQLIIAGASAYPRTIDFAKFAEIAMDAHALLMADVAHIAGLIVAQLHPTSIGHADVTTTTTHKTLRGPRGAIILAKKELGAKLDKSVMP
ncbi:MAG: serine hydroxymethyltransferase, partial [Candidatus Kerfeldbacteria bacterium]|nr:serine hydroxymethyltransferase [Candidatus Kerfeldbacteria bacterium]